MGLSLAQHIFVHKKYSGIFLIVTIWLYFEGFYDNQNNAIQYKNNTAMYIS